VEPAITSIFEEDPLFRTDQIDIVGCGSSLGNLLRFAAGEPQPFRFLVHAIGDTVFFARQDNERLQGIRGYGHTFPEAYTSWPASLKGSESHQRVIRYQLAGMTVLTRFEGDGYLPDLFPGYDAAEVDNLKQTTNSTTVEDLAKELIIGMNPISSPSDQELQVDHGGFQTPQDAIFDLKTRSIRKIDDDILEGELPRLWLRQIPNFILAFHDHGTFDDVRIEDVRARIHQWESAHQDTLRKFASLLNMIVSKARDMSSGKFEVRLKEDGPLELRRVVKRDSDALPASLMKQWIENGEIEPPPTAGSSDGFDRFSDYYDEEEADTRDFTACSADHCGYCGRCSY
jgi:hypothetical protein